MAEALVMPTLGLTMTEGTVDQWYKKIGDQVTKGEAVVSISSEKLTHDVESPIDGVLLDIIVEQGGEVPCQDNIGYVGKEGETFAKEEVLPETKTVESEASEKQVKPETIEKVKGRMNEVVPIFATPLAKKIAAEKDYSLEDISGTGGNNRITRRDVERYIPSSQIEGENKRVGTGLKGMRKVIAQRMYDSLQQTAQVTLHKKVNITALLAFRKELKEKAGLAIERNTISINTLLIKAVAKALKEHSEMNATYDGKMYHFHEAVHMGIAVALDEGLVVPVIKDVDKKALTQIGTEFVEVTQGALNETLSIEAYQGSTFTITNLGNLDIEYFTPVLNTPEVGILGVGSSSSKLIFNEAKTIEEIYELPLSLTFDHQVVDGAPAAEFLGTIAHYLENPYLLVV